MKVILNNLGKKYEQQKNNSGREWAIRNLSLEIEDNDFITFVGPSGCGKSTTLNMIAGLEDISEGELIVDGQKINDLMSKDRDIAMVFQSYALYPHLTVRENIGFGLTIRKVDKKIIDQKVEEVALQLDLSDYLDVRPKDLSGGQQQRVALARALARKPKIFLMDEPLSNLDVKLRVSTRKKIREIHNMLDTVTFYVTHDQSEALTMSDKIVVMSDGKVEQIGSPREVYTKPNNIFVSRFIGNVPMNIIKGSIKNGYFIGEDYNMKIKLLDSHLKQLEGYKKKQMYLGFRAENVSSDNLMKTVYPEAGFELKIEQIEYLGAQQYMYTSGGWSNNIIVNVDAREKYSEGDVVNLTFDASKLFFFDIDTEEKLI